MNAGCIDNEERYQLFLRLRPVDRSKTSTSCNLYSRLKITIEVQFVYWYFFLYQRMSLCKTVELKPVHVGNRIMDEKIHRMWWLSSR